MIHDDQLQDRTRQLFEASIAVKHQFVAGHLGGIVALAKSIAASIERGGKLLLCGNGGSAADAQHLAAELLVRLRPHVNREAMPAIALALDTSSLTACGNDYGFDEFYERMTLALGRPGDVLLGITTSGKSPNVLRALQAARGLQMTTAGLLGCGGGPALACCDHAIVVPSNETGRIQECHITIGHALMELVEDLLIDSGRIKLRPPASATS